MNVITNNRIELIISEVDSLILQSIQGNLSHRIEHIINFKKAKDFINSYPKVDLLISLDEVTDIQDLLYKAKLVVNLTDRKLIDSEVKLSQPFRLKDLINIINESRNRKQLFCNIDDWLYDEQLACIFNSQDKVFLTEKENAVIKYFLLAPSSEKIQKHDLLKDVWSYHQDSDSVTIETHLFRLKNKLPNKVKSLIRME